jgi:three-Cys-motif partner protein
MRFDRPTFCAACGEPLDTDYSNCQVCGEDHSPEPITQDDQILVLPDVQLDRLGDWSQIKLEILEKYGHAYTTIMTQQNVIRAAKYVDAFSGAGIAEDRETGALLAGSARRAVAVHPPFDELHFIEHDEDKVTVLRDALGQDPRVRVHSGDAINILRSDVLPTCRYENYVRALCLLDPYGLTVPWTLVHEIGRMRSIEIFYNFMIVGANRNVLWTNPERVPPRRLKIMDLVWGDRSWKDAAYQPQEDLFGVRLEKMPNEALAQAFRKRLRDVAGFKYVPEPIPMKNSRKATVYYLFFASHNDTGGRIVGEIFSKYER